MVFNCIFLGAPGSGKGTQAKRLQAQLNIPHISTGDMLRQEIAKGSDLGNRVKEIMAQGRLIDDQLMTEVIEKRFSASDIKTGFMLDGYPRTVNQAASLKSIIEKLSLQEPKTIYIKLGFDELKNRLLGRLSCSKCGSTFHVKLNPPKTSGICDACGSQLSQRKDDTEEAVVNRLKVFEKETAPLLDYYKQSKSLIEINGAQEMEKITADILRSLKA